jgi:hypothetical protein
MNRRVWISVENVATNGKCRIFQLKLQWLHTNVDGNIFQVISEIGFAIRLTAQVYAVAKYTKSKIIQFRAMGSGHTHKAPYRLL